MTFVREESSVKCRSVLDSFNRYLFALQIPETWGWSVMYAKYGHIPNVKKLPKKNIKPLRKNTPRLAGSAKNAKR